MAYDESVGGSLLFGGMVFNREPNDWDDCYALNDTWLFQKRKWCRLELSKSPEARQRAAMVYDVGNRQLILFGGQLVGGQFAILNDTWAFRDRQWHQIKSVIGKKPPSRFGHSMTYDSASNQIVMFGGASSIERSLGDTWTHDGKRWRRLKVSGPAPRRYAAFGFDPELGGCILQGGVEDDFGELPCDETWLLKDSEWHELPGHRIGEFRDDHDVVYDYRLRKLLLTNGKTGSGLMFRTSEGWQPMPNQVDELNLQCAPVVYAKDLEATVSFGGETDEYQTDETRVLEEV